MKSAYLIALMSGIERFQASQRDPFEVFDAVLLAYSGWSKAVRKLSIPPDILVVGDSGGFTAGTQGTDYDVEKVLRWQMANCHLGYMLDRPPYKGEASIEREGPDPALWKSALKVTLKKFKRARRHYDPEYHPFRWWGIVQGETRAQQEEWYGAVSEVYPFQYPGEGWAMRPFPNNDLEAVARCVRFASDKGILNLHLLQTTGPSAVAILLALGEMADLDFTSFDSTSAGLKAIYRKTFDKPESYPAFRFDETREDSRAGETFTRDYMLSGKCDCPACQWFAEDEIPLGTDYSHYLMLHNYCVNRDNFSALEAEAHRDPEALIEAAAGPAAGAVLQAFEGRSCG